MKKSGFTVWELLAVMLILLVVAIILFPVFAKVHETKPYRACASYQKQLGLAITQYVQDNDEEMPNIADVHDKNDTWRVMIYPYCKSTGIYQCPSHDAKFIEQNQKYDTPDGLPSSYAANYTGNYSGSKIDKGDGAFAGPGSKPVNKGEIKDPASLIELCEVWHHSTPDFNIDNLGAFNPASDMLWAGHSNESNYLFVDGHVKYYKPLDTKDYWHRNASIPLSAGSVKVLQNAYQIDAK